MSQVLEEIGSQVAGLAERIGPSVVGLGRGWGHGSGVVVAPGRVLTNAHVLRGGEVAVSAGGEVVAGRVAGIDADRDVAVVAADIDAPPAEWGDPGTARIGSPVVALADPGGRGLRATFGIVSSVGRSFRGPRGRRVAGLIEHSAPLPRGSSGGPLVDTGGRLIGINAVRTDGGLILAIPADAALRDRVEALARGESVGRPRLGVAIAPPRAAHRIRAAAGLPERDGLLIRAVLEGSPAERAGLRRGDLLIAAGEQPLASVDDLLDALEEAGPELVVSYLRGIEEAQATVILQEVK